MDEVHVGDLAEILTALITAVGIFLAYFELRRNTRIQRAQFLLETTERYFGESEARRLFYDIDYNSFKLQFVNGTPSTVQRGEEDPKPFLGSDEERWLDSLLYTFDVIGRMVELKSLNVREADIFAFQAKRVLGNHYVKAYVDWVNEERVKENIRIPAHQAAYRLVSRFDKRQDRSQVEYA